MDCSLPGSYIHGIFQARILEWVSILLQGIFQTQESNPGRLHRRQIPALQVASLPTELQGKPYGYLIFTFNFSIKTLLIPIIYYT